jgi:hypothetical protein
MEKHDMSTVADMMILKSRAFRILCSTFILVSVICHLPTSLAMAGHTPDPSSVTIAGSLQSEFGCPGDWQPECSSTYLTYDSDDTVWQEVFDIPAGSWEYKAALNDSWVENYGAGAQQDGPNIQLNLGAGTAVKFYYDHQTHWVTDNVNSVIPVAVGDFQSALGSPGDWDPSNLRSWLQDPDGDGTFTSGPHALPAGDYEAKVAIDESWDENYGAGGVPGGANIPFTVPLDTMVIFSFDYSTKVLTIEGVPGDTPPTEVGGEVYPANKVAVLAPWLALVAVLIVGTAFAIRRCRATS